MRESLRADDYTDDDRRIAMLQGVTVTGADDEVDPRELVALTREFPFVEWGILMSISRCGSPRYPTRKWMVGLENVAKDARRTNDPTVKPMALSAHFCGQVARAALSGSLHDLPVIEEVQRIQVNGYVAPSPGLIRFAERMPCYEIILQVRDEGSLQAAANDARAMRSASLLFDPSGGRGLEPFKWPRAPAGMRVGYAGGITPGNVRESVQRVYEDTGFLAGDFWIDLESGARDERDRFDLERVRRLLEYVAPLIGVATV